MDSNVFPINNGPQSVVIAVKSCLVLVFHLVGQYCYSCVKHLPLLLVFTFVYIYMFSDICCFSGLQSLILIFCLSLFCHLLLLPNMLLICWLFYEL